MVNPISSHTEAFALALAQQLSQISPHPLNPDDLHLHITGPQSFQLWVLSADTCQTYACQYDSHHLYVDQQGQRQSFSLEPQSVTGQVLSQGSLTSSQVDPRYAPINAKLSHLAIQVGQNVQTGDPLYVLTAMKMQMTYHAPCGGWITHIHAQAGETLNQGQIIFDWTQENPHET